MGKQLEHIESKESKELSPEQCREYLRTIDEQLLPLQQYLRISEFFAVDIDTPSIVGLAQQLLEQYLKIGEQIGLDQFYLDEDSARLHDLQGLGESEAGLAMARAFLLESEYVVKYPLRFDVALQSYDQQIELDELQLKGLLSNIEQANKLIQEQYDLLALQGEVVRENLLGGEVDLLALQESVYVPDRAGELIQQQEGGLIPLTVEEKQLLLLYFGALDLEQVESSRMVEYDAELEADAEALAHESNGSYLWMLGRLMAAGYIVDDNPPRKGPESKSLRVRMYGKVWYFVKKTSKRGINLLQNANRRGRDIFRNSLPTFIEAERRLLQQHLANSISNREYKMKVGTLQNMLDTLSKSAKRGSESSISRNLVKYQQTFDRNGIHKLQGSVIGVQSGGFASAEYMRQQVGIERVKTELNVIEGQLESRRKKVATNLRRLNLYAQMHPEKAAQYRQEAIKYTNQANAKMLALQELGVNKIRLLDDESLRGLKGSSKFVSQFFAFNSRMQQGIERFESSKAGKRVQRVGKFMIGWGILRMAVQGTMGGEDGIDWWKDAADIGIGFVPIAGGINDLVVFAKGTDWNGRQLTPKELGERLAFGIIGLIPGVGYIVKVAKGGKSIKNGTRAARAMAAMRGVGTMMERAGGMYAYGALGIYGIMEVKDLAMTGFNFVEDELTADEDTFAPTMEGELGLPGEVEVSIAEELPLKYLTEQVAEIRTINDFDSLQARCTELYNKLGQDNPELYEVMKFMVLEAWRDQLVSISYLSPLAIGDLGKDLPTEMYDIAVALFAEQEKLHGRSQLTIRTASTSFKMSPSNYLTPALVQGYVETLPPEIGLSGMLTSLPPVGTYANSGVAHEYMVRNQLYVDGLRVDAAMRSMIDGTVPMAIEGLLIADVQYQLGNYPSIVMTLRDEHAAYSIKMPLLSILEGGVIDLTHRRIRQKAWGLYNEYIAN